MEENKKSFATIALSVSLLRKHEGSHYQQFNGKVLALTMQFAYTLCVALYALLSVVGH